MSIDKKILEWARERGILDSADPIAQASKTVEEVAEVMVATVKGDYDEVVDGIGDTYVTLVILASMYGMSVEECARVAYREIAKRKGKMVGGLFVKDEES